MVEIQFSRNIKELLPELRLGCFQALIKTGQSSIQQTQYIDDIIQNTKKKFSIEEVSQSDIINSTKESYRKLGKDPSRYRPSAEALTRRVVQGKGLYQVNNVVDILNAISINTGFSIGGYDIMKLSEPIIFGVGEENEPYEAIGRGKLNIENLPILRDVYGAFGSPTSDSLRTCINNSTTSFLMVFFDFSGSDKLFPVLEEASRLYKKYCGAKEISMDVLR